MKHIARPGRLDIDDETAVTWDPESLEVTHLDLGSYAGSEPAGEALARLGSLMRRQGAASAVMQQCMEALMKRRLKTEPASAEPVSRPLRIPIPASYYQGAHGDPVAQFDHLVLVLHPGGRVTWKRADQHALLPGQRCPGVRD